ncbi:hypothetical protein [Bacillus cereus]|uniref:hypothetical protein n=1 Tax=Bacillus cereus TaxID=1396 RepID=UPI000B4B75E3|nr:hypothetical protein [Bacillus cereus]
MFKNFVKEEDGSGILEYVLLLSLVGVMAVTIFPKYKPFLVDTFNDMTKNVETALNGKGDGGTGEGDWKGPEQPKEENVIEKQYEPRLFGVGDAFIYRSSKGNIYSWGRDMYGELGNGVFSKNIPLGKIYADMKVKDVQLGIGSNTFFLLEDGTLQGIGMNDRGQLGNGKEWERVSPIITPVIYKDGTPVKDVVDISVGSVNTIALLKDGTALSWGDNRTGSAGYTTREYPTDLMNIYSHNANFITDTTGTKKLTGVKKVFAGDLLSFAFLDNDSIVGWGTDRNYGLGLGTKSEYNDHPQLFSYLKPSQVLQFAPGYRSSFAVLKTNEVVEWGRIGGWGKVEFKTDLYAYDEEVLKPRPTKQLVGKKVKKVLPNNFHNLALLEDGTLYAWGSNKNGQLGNNKVDTAAGYSEGYVVGPDKKGKLTDIVNIWTTTYGNFAVNKKGEFYAWGKNTFSVIMAQPSNEEVIPYPVLLKMPE